MKNQLLNLSYLLGILMLSQLSFAQSNPPVSHHKDSLVALTKKYYQLNIKVFQTGSTLADIEAIFELFSPDFTYVHPKYGGVYTRKSLYNGYVNNQKKGNYNGREADVKVTKMIVGLNAVAVKRAFIIRDAKTGKLSEGERKMTLFEFKDGKISRIYEYW
ncbi:nuclear transport factor 2 family protein [Microscilla marina]|uniref:SnoaL-like domain-containing protein n=1 Tax=Microscilla marina ATCC 23134 TaxID=313606 RepID=A1ZQ00_MICM2|nr:nuclear transport factor 2 family protein [Microscilla marina]EAY27409.1 hypothetical protein M23134_06810 [Microscilla marina ATCC 23134]